MTFEEIQELEDKNPLLYLKDYVLDVDNNEEFIRKFLIKLNDNHCTYPVGHSEGQPKGFTSTRRRRSMGDIYRITKFYFPETTVKDVVEILKEGIKEGHFGSLQCPDIKKRVFIDKRSEQFRNSWPIGLLHVVEMDEYNNIFKDTYLEKEVIEEKTEVTT